MFSRALAGPECATVYVRGPIKRRFVAHAEKSVYDFNTLHEAVILVGHFIFPSAETPARIYMVAFQLAAQASKHFVPTHEGRRVAMYIRAGVSADGNMKCPTRI